MTSTMTLADNYATLTADVAATTAARAALEQRIKELEADAGRYRWLRQTQVALSLPCQTVAMLVADVTELDRAMSEAALQKMADISQEYKLP